jgi:hypothetical protein
VCGSDGCASSSDLLILGQSRRRQAENPLIDLSRFSSPALSASFSNFVVAGHRSDHAVRAAIPFADVEG